jgi:hypothetical protein
VLSDWFSLMDERVTGGMLSILLYFIEKTALNAPVVNMFDTSWLTTLQVAPPPGVVDALGVQ